MTSTQLVQAITSLGQRQAKNLTPVQTELLLCWVGVHEATILPREEMKDFLERGYVSQEIERGDIIYKPTAESLKAARALARELNVGNGRVLNAEAQP